MTIEEDGLIQLDKDEYDKLKVIIAGISKKYTDWSGLEYDDLYSTLWIKSLEVIKKTKRFTPNLIAVSCFNKAYDLCRAAKRKVTVIKTNSDYIDEVLSDSLVNSCDDRTFLDNIIIQEIVDMFPRNSRERNYLVYLTLFIGLPIKDHEEKKLTFKKVFGKFPDSCRRELALAKVLGFSDDTSAGYRNAKYNVRNKLKEIYNIK